MSTYVPKKSTQPIRTGQNSIIYILAAIVSVILVLWGSLLMDDIDYFKFGVIILPLLLLFFREGYRLSRRNKIQKSRFHPNPPYAWNIQTSAPFVEKTLLGSFSKQFSGLDDVKKPLLFLVEKKSDEDHQAHLYDLFIGSLQEKGLTLQRYYHSGDMQFFWNETQMEKITLDKIQSQFKGYALIYCGDGHRAVNPSADELQWWTYHIYGWQQRYVLTNRPLVNWDHHESVLSNLFSVLPFYDSGITTLGKQLKGENISFPIASIKGLKAIDLENENLISVEVLESIFGKKVCSWIAAVALSSKIDWDLTLQIGHQLTNTGQTLVTLENIKALARLPWFRHGEIPDEMRQELEVYLDPDTRRSVRQLIVTALEEHPVPASSHAHNSFRMELAGLKSLIPQFPQKGIKNELYELKSMGYQEDTLVTNWIDGQKWWVDRLIPKSLEKVAYNEGFFLLGRSFWFFLPLLLLFGWGVTAIPDKEIEPYYERWSTWIHPKADEDNPRLIGQNGQTNDPEDPEPGFEIIDPDPVIIDDKPGITDDPETVEEPEEPVIELQWIGGRISDIDGDKITDAEIFIPAISLRTDALQNGSFSTELTETVEANELVKVHINSEGYHPKNIDIRAGRQNADIVLIPKTLEITVKDGETRNRLSDALVNVAGQEKVTDGNGKVRMDLSPDLEETSKLLVRVEKERYNVMEMEESISKSMEVLMYKTPLISISGKVLDENGDPIDNVNIHSEYGEKWTGRQGEFTYRVPENKPSFDAHFEHQDYFEKTQRLARNRSNTVELESRNITLTFSGKIIDKCSLRGIYYARINVEGVATRLTNRNGGFSFLMEVPKGQRNNLNVDISMDGYHDLNKTVYWNDIEKEHSFAIRTATFTGTVVKENGQPLSNAIVNLEGRGNFQTNGSGTFSAKVPGDFSCKRRATISKTGYKSKTLILESGDEITLERDIEILELSGIVQNRCEQSPIHRAEIKLSGVGTRISKTDGSFDFELELDKGTTKQYTMTISKDGYHPRTLEISSTNLNKYPKINLTPETVGGRVKEEGGSWVSGARVRIGSNSDYTGNDGSFSVPLPSNSNCNLTISVTKSGFDNYQNYFQPGEIVKIRKQAPSGTTVIIKTIKIVNGQEIPIQGARVQIDGVNRGSTNSRGEKTITVQKQIGQSIRVRILGSQNYHEQSRTVTLTRQNQPIKYSLTGFN
jgi:hypothetical protein